MFVVFSDLWRYRHFVISSIRNEVVGRFTNSKLGGLWIILNPLAQVLIYTLVLSNVLSARLPGIESKYSFAIYLMSGLLAFNLFSDIVGRCLVLFVEQGNLMKKVSFPRVTLPTIAIGSSLLNNILLFVVMLGIFALLGHELSLSMFWLIPLSVVVAMFALGIGLSLGVMNVFMRDIGQVMPIVLQVWFWFTPIVYPASIIPESYRHLLIFNPMYSLVEAYHQVLVYNVAPELDKSILITFFVSLALMLFSLFLFRRASSEMVDVL